MNRSELVDYQEEHNRLINNPLSYVPALKDRLLRMGHNNKITIKPGVKLVTKEGKAAIKEAIDYLSKVKPRKVDLKISPALCKAAQGHAKDSGKHAITGHIGSNGSTMNERIEKYVKEAEWIGENCNYSIFTNAKDVLLDLLIDDGVDDRSHRSTLFNTNFT